MFLATGVKLHIHLHVHLTIYLCNCLTLCISLRTLHAWPALSCRRVSPVVQRGQVAPLLLRRRGTQIRREVENGRAVRIKIPDLGKTVVPWGVSGGNGSGGSGSELRILVHGGRERGGGGIVRDVGRGGESRHGDGGLGFGVDAAETPTGGRGRFLALRVRVSSDRHGGT
jgi:hypothetical protein